MWRLYDLYSPLTRDRGPADGEQRWCRHGSRYRFQSELPEHDFLQLNGATLDRQSALTEASDATLRLAAS
jgi:hypothetical protein